MYFYVFLCIGMGTYWEPCIPMVYRGFLCIPMGDFMKLSITTIDAAVEKTKAESLKEHVLWDNTMPGFGARISPKGKVSFILMYRHQGRRRKLTIGRYGCITLHQAREQAKTHFGEIIAGQDPAGRKRELQTGMTMKELCEYYAEKHGRAKRSWRNESSLINSHIIPKLGNRRIASIGYHDIVKFHREITALVVANRCLSLLSRMFNLAKDWMLLDPTFTNPVTGVEKNPENSRSRYIHDDEMPLIMAEILNYPDPFIKGALQICLFTGVRQARVMSLEWTDINIESKILYERNSKTAKTEKEIFTHPLTSSSIEVFLSLPRKDKFVFLDGFSREHQTKRMRLAWKEIKQKAKIVEAAGQELWLHDLRRTLGSWLVKNNYSTNIAKQALNHKSLVAAQRYQHISDGNTVRDALEDVTQKMVNAATP